MELLSPVLCRRLSLRCMALVVEVAASAALVTIVAALGVAVH